MEGKGFPINEEPVRQWVLRAYHSHRGQAGPPGLVLAAMRQFLSGAPGSDFASDRYWFEEDPAGSVASFVEDLDRAEPNLAQAVIEPLLSSLRHRREQGEPEIADNLSVYVSNLAGAVAVKASLDETLACGAISAAIIALSRLDAELFEAALRKPRQDRRDR